MRKLPQLGDTNSQQIGFRIVFYSVLFDLMCCFYASLYRNRVERNTNENRIDNNFNWFTYIGCSSFDFTLKIIVVVIFFANFSFLTLLFIKYCEKTKFYVNFDWNWKISPVLTIFSTPGHCLYQPAQETSEINAFKHPD